MKSNKVNFTSIDDYIASFPKEARKILEELRATIKAAAPETEQKISHNIPTFTLNGKYLVYFAVEKSYLNVPNPLRHRSVQ